MIRHGELHYLSALLVEQVGDEMLRDIRLADGSFSR
jgi:hypothetical protein